MKRRARPSRPRIAHVEDARAIGVKVLVPIKSNS